jgi:helicase MOV-10
MTRAQALLIIVGDPNVLSIDRMWRSFLNYIHNNGGWKGRPISWDPLEAEELLADPTRNLAAERRTEAQIDMDGLLARTRDITLGDGAENDDDAGNDAPWLEGN